MFSCVHKSRFCGRVRVPGVLLLPPSVDIWVRFASILCHGLGRFLCYGFGRVLCYGCDNILGRFASTLCHGLGRFLCYGFGRVLCYGFGSWWWRRAVPARRFGLGVCVTQVWPPALGSLLTRAARGGGHAVGPTINATGQKTGQAACGAVKCTRRSGPVGGLGCAGAVPQFVPRIF